MPWVRKGNKVYKRLPSGSLKLKQTCGSAEKAKAAIRLLHMKEK